MQRTKPPFRADHVGSLLRPAALKEAREKHAKGEIDAAALKAVEDREIERVIKKQEEVGLKAITDGEFRRSWWHLDFLWGLDGAGIVILGVRVVCALTNLKCSSIGWLEKPSLPTMRAPSARVCRPWNAMPCSIT